MSYRAVVIIALLTFFSSCTTVSPWQKGNLAKPEMSWAPDPLNSTLDKHVFSSKEGSSGGGGAAGGGCGCN